MNRIFDAIATFNIGSRQDLPKGSTERPSRNEDPGPVSQSQRTGERFYHLRRQSTFDILRPKSKKGEDITAEKVVDRQKFIRGRREDLRQTLINEKAELIERISVLNLEIERKCKLLRSLTAKDDAEKWEDELFETRLKELRGARAVINTQSSVTEEDVRHQIKDLNSIIVQTAEIAAETPLQTQRSVTQLEDMKYLGKNLSIIFQQAENRLDDQGFVRAILQIFLTESCMELIDSWHLENSDLNVALRGLYSHIRGKGEFFAIIASSPLLTSMQRNKRWQASGDRSHLANRHKEPQASSYRNIQTKRRNNSCKYLLLLGGEVMCPRCDPSSKQ